jgi:Signal transduction histidine kinase
MSGDARADLFGRLFETSAVPTALISVDPAGIGTILGSNDALDVLLGYPTVVGRTLTELTDERDRPADEPNRARLAAGATNVFRREKRYVRSDGAVIPLHTYATVIDRPLHETVVITIFLDDSSVASVQAQLGGIDRFAEALADLRSSLLREEPTQVVLELICSWARRILDAYHAGLMEIVEPDLLRIRAVDDAATKGVVGLTWPVNHAQFSDALVSGLATRYQVSQEELVGLADRYPDVSRPPRQLFLAMAPVLTADRTLGALIASRGRAPFDDEELALLELFASEVSEALTVAQLRTDLARLALIEDRERIARNLHDEIIQDLIGVRLGLVHLLQRTLDDEACEELAESLTQLDLVTTRVRDVVAGLEEGASMADFRDTLTSMTSSKANSAHIGWTMQIEGELERLADDERVEIMRVLNEAVSNVVRHSDATQVGVALSVSPDALTLVVDDDGIGFDAAGHVVGMGLRNLNLRAIERGGNFEVRESPDGGTQLRWSIPLRARA